MKHSMSKDELEGDEPYSLGGGVKPSIPPLEVESEEDQPKHRIIDKNYAEDVRDGSHVILGSDGRVRWGTMPPKTDMLQDNNMYRTGPPQVKLFVLPDDIEEYNKFLLRTGNTGMNLDGDPEMMLETNHEEFWRGKFYIRMTYREIFYRQLFDKK